MIKLQIGNLKIQIYGLENGKLPDNTRLFETDFDNSDLYYNFYTNKKLILPETAPTYRKNDIIVYKNQSGLESRLLIFPEQQSAYAYIQETASGITDIYFNPAYLKMIDSDTIFYSMLALEKHLYLHNFFIFHCSYIDYDGKAILFSGPSGIGKTTHTNLWRRYKPDKVTILNGDKCLLSYEGGKLYANGWPICGTSGICHNEKREVKAIVLLQQSEENKIIEEKKTVLFRRILEQLTVNYWNKDFVNAVMTFVQTIISTVPCYTYTCNISQEAVDIIYKKVIG